MRNALLIACLLLIATSPSVAREPQQKPAAARGWLGFGFELHRETGQSAWLHVRRVTRDGPAFKAGLRPQDVIVEIDHKPVAFATDRAALDFFSGRRAGEKVVFTLARASGRVRLTVIAEPQPAGAVAAWKRNYDQAASRDRKSARPAN